VREGLRTHFDIQEEATRLEAKRTLNRRGEGTGEILNAKKEIGVKGDGGLGTSETALQRGAQARHRKEGGGGGGKNTSEFY